VPIGLRRRKFSEDEQSTTAAPSRTPDNSWRINQRNPAPSLSTSYRSKTAEKITTARPQRAIHRQWSNQRVTTVPVKEQQIRPRVQSQQEAVRKDTPTLNEEELSKSSRFTSSVTNFRTSSAVKPPRSTVRRRITINGRFESGNLHQSSPGTRYKNQTNLNKKGEPINYNMLLVLLYFEFKQAQSFYC